MAVEWRLRWNCLDLFLKRAGGRAAAGCLRMICTGEKVNGARLADLFRVSRETGARVWPAQ